MTMVIAQPRIQSLILTNFYNLSIFVYSSNHESNNDGLIRLQVGEMHWKIIQNELKTKTISLRILTFNSGPSTLNEQEVDSALLFLCTVLEEFGLSYI